MASDRMHDTLFLACTRPAMIGGVTMEAMAINMIATCILFIAAGNVFYAATGGVLHLVFRELCKHDPNIFRLLFIWMETKGRYRTARFWGGSSPTPLKLVRRYNEKDFSLA
jgi:type IV secretion system protein VirB3